VTVFAPTNNAFARLPKGLQRFLFSRFGERALKKLLEFHIVPEFILYSDWSHNASEAEDAARNVMCQHHVRDSSQDEELSTAHDDASHALWAPRRRPGSHRPLNQNLVFEKNITAPTLLDNFSIRVHVEQSERLLPRHTIFTKVVANGQTVVAPDVVATNGALHVVDHLLNPLKGRHPHHRPGSAHDPAELAADYPQASTDEDEDEWKDWEEWLPAWADEE